MTALTRFFFRAPSFSSNTWAVVRWWESRRLAYNVAVLAAGVVSLTAVAVADLLPPNPKVPGIPWGGILVYGLLANLFFSLGPAVDALVCRRWGRNYDAVGPALFRYGFAFAIGLTLLPIPLAAIGWGLKLLKILIYG
jgi:hypothetical protein